MAKLSRNQSNVRAYRNSDGGNVWRRREKKRNAFSLRFFLLGTVSTIRNTSATLTTPASNARTSVKPAECCARTPEALPIQGFALDWHHLSSPHIFTHPSFFVQSLSLLNPFSCNNYFRNYSSVHTTHSTNMPKAFTAQSTPVSSA